MNETNKLLFITTFFGIAGLGLFMYKNDNSCFDSINIFKDDDESSEIESESDESESESESETESENKILDEEKNNKTIKNVKSKNQKTRKKK